MRLDDRMKGYERAYNIKLPARLPVILRIDGNSFSKFTKKMGFKKPFDDTFIEAMDKTTKAILNYCSGAILGYYQSDEISILLRNDQTFNTDPFLSNRLNKICSLISGIASSTFSLHFQTTAIFDCRAFVVPENEVANYFLWRQQDAYRNAVQGYAYYTIANEHGRRTAQKILHGKNIEEQLDKIYEYGVRFHEEPIDYIMGVILKKKEMKVKIRDIIKPENISKVSVERLNEEKVISRWVKLDKDEVKWFNEYENEFYRGV